MSKWVRGVFLSALFLSGCMPFRFYPLPVSAAEARDTFAPLATAASNLGYRYSQWPDRVTVLPDPATRIDYSFDAAGNYAMCVMIKDKNLPGGVEAAFAAAKAKGDELWNRAMDLRRATMPAQVIVPVAAPPQTEVQINIGR